MDEWFWDIDECSDTRLNQIKDSATLFFYHNIKVKENVFSECELKKALRDTLTRAALSGLLSTTAN